MSQEGLEQSDQNIDKKLEKLMNDMPDEVKEEIFEGIASVQRTQSMSFPPEALVMSKITEDHISEYLSAARENMNKSYEEKRNNKIFLGFLILIALIFVIVVIVLLKSQPQVMEKIIYIILAFLGGAAGGYGIGKRTGSNNDED